MTLKPYTIEVLATSEHNLVMPLERVCMVAVLEEAARVTRVLVVALKSTPHGYRGADVLVDRLTIGSHVVVQHANPHGLQAIAMNYDCGPGHQVSVDVSSAESCCVLVLVLGVREHA